MSRDSTLEGCFWDHVRNDVMAFQTIDVFVAQRCQSWGQGQHLFPIDLICTRQIVIMSTMDAWVYVWIRKWVCAVRRRLCVWLCINNLVHAERTLVCCLLPPLMSEVFFTSTNACTDTFYFKLLALSSHSLTKSNDAEHCFFLEKLISFNFILGMLYWDDKLNCY